MSVAVPELPPEEADAIAARIVGPRPATDDASPPDEPRPAADAAPRLEELTRRYEELLAELAALGVGSARRPRADDPT